MAGIHAFAMGSDSRHSPHPMQKAVFVPPVCGKVKEKSRTFLQRTALGV